MASEPFKFRYIVRINTGVSIGTREYIEIVTLPNPAPAIAAIRAFNKVARRDPDNQLWQSDKVTVVVERER